MAGVRGGVGVSTLRGGHFALGVGVGSTLTLLTFLALDFFGSVIAPASELWAAIIGAIIGGGISLAGQVLQADSQAAERNETLRFSDLATAYTMFEVLNLTLSQVRAISNHIKLCFETAVAINEPLSGLAVKPLSGNMLVPVIPMECKVFILRMKQIEFYNEINNIDVFVNNLCKMFEDLQGRRSEILDLLDSTAYLNGMGFKAQAGKEVEVEMRNEVLVSNFFDLSKDLIEAEARIINCIGHLIPIIRNLGDKRFEIELKPV
jgi:hypothetical protein